MNENEVVNTDGIQLEQKPSIKLIKNTKGYNWEIKILELNVDALDEINKRMVEKYGVKDEPKTGMD